MQFIFTAALVGILLPLVLAQTLYSISYDVSYNEASTPVEAATCTSQLSSQGYATYGAIPTFPFLGGFANITGYKSAYCGQYVMFKFAGNFAGVMLIGSADGLDFVILEEAMNALTNNMTTYPQVNAHVVKGLYSC